MKIGLLGGSFDPVHAGHLKLAAAALRQLKLDRVYFVISPMSPFKTDRDLAPSKLRLAMVRAALKGKKRLLAADWEMKRRGPSYTITTLRGYRRRRPQDEVHFIFGTDALKGLPRWRKANEIARHATLVAGLRPGATWPRLPKTIAPAVVRLKGTFPDISSTEIRRALKNGRAARLVPPAALAILKKHGLYR